MVCPEVCPEVCLVDFLVGSQAGFQAAHRVDFQAGSLVASQAAPRVGSLVASLALVFRIPGRIRDSREAPIRAGSLDRSKAFPVERTLALSQILARRQDFPARAPILAAMLRRWPAPSGPAPKP